MNFNRTTAANRIFKAPIEKPDIVEVIKKYMELKRMGTLYAGQCPFHATNTMDSFRVSPSRQYYKCFNTSCGAAGDVYDFVMRIENCSFPEAKDKLHMRLTPFKTAPKYSPPKVTHNQPVLNAAISYWKFHYQYAHEGGHYLATRGVKERNLIDRLNIGYAPKSGLEEYMKGCGFTKEQLVTEGLVRKGKYGFYDHFRERVIFPIYDMDGNVKTITSRTVLPDLSLRHLHLPGSIDTFFNEPVLKEGGPITIVEGILDCLTLLQAGFQAMAVYGTEGLKEDMAKKLKNADTVFLAFDKEENNAGACGAAKALELLRAQKVENVHVIELPFLNSKKMDINDLFMQHGFTKEDFSELMEDALCRNAA